MQVCYVSFHDFSFCKNKDFILKFIFLPPVIAFSSHIDCISVQNFQSLPLMVNIYRYTVRQTDRGKSNILVPVSRNIYKYMHIFYGVSQVSFDHILNLYVVFHLFKGIKISKPIKGHIYFI